MSKPENQGKRWTSEDESKVATLKGEGRSVTEIAKELKRSNYSIQCKLADEGVRMLGDNKSMEDVVKFTGLSKEFIEQKMETAKNKKDNTSISVESKECGKVRTRDTRNTRHQELMEMLGEIRDLLKKEMTLIKSSP